MLFRLLVALTIALVWERGAASVLASEPGGAPATNEVVYYVDNQQEDASDQNTGFERGAPLRTVGAALARARGDILAGRAARIIIANGTYRESLTLNFSDQEPASGAALVIEAAEPGKVTISGSDVYTDWQPLGAGVYAHPWPFKWGFAENPWTTHNVVMEPLALRGEMVFINGERLRQVLADDELRAAPMTFLVDEDKEQILIHVGHSVQIADALIEVATRSHLLHIRNGKNITIRGIRFQHAGKPLRSFAVLLTGSYFRIDTCEFVENNDIALWIDAYNVLVSRSKFMRNGFHGLNFARSSFLRINDSEISENNWRGSLGNFYSWDPSNKQRYVHDQIWDNVKIIRNMATGLWFDTGNSNIIIKNSIFSHNLFTGLMIEANDGPFDIHDNVFCYNNELYSSVKKSHHSRLGSILILESKNINIYNNLFWKNRFYQFVISSYDNRMRPSNFTFKYNKIIMDSFHSAALGLPDPKAIEFSSDQNAYLSSHQHAMFLIILGAKYGEGQELTFAEWQQQTGQDQNSTWEEHAPDQIPQGCELSPAQ